MVSLFGDFVWHLPVQIPWRSWWNAAPPAREANVCESFLVTESSHWLGPWVQELLAIRWEHIREFAEKSIWASRDNKVKTGFASHKFMVRTLHGLTGEDSQPKLAQVSDSHLYDTANRFARVSLLSVKRTLHKNKSLDTIADKILTVWLPQNVAVMDAAMIRNCPRCQIRASVTLRIDCVKRTLQETP